MTSKNSENRKLGQITKAIFKWSLISLVSVVPLALITESYFKNQNVKNYPATGQLYQVSEHKMYIWCEGSGEPVIVLDSGASMFSVGWRWVMPQLSPATRVCAFDHSGLGWSLASAPPYDLQYPKYLSALIMLEPANPEIFLQEIGEDRGTKVVRGAAISDCGMRCVMVALFSSLGVIDIALGQIEVINDPLFHAMALAEHKARINRTDALRFLAQR